MYKKRITHIHRMGHGILCQIEQDIPSVYLYLVLCASFLLYRCFLHYPLVHLPSRRPIPVHPPPLVVHQGNPREEQEEHHPRTEHPPAPEATDQEPCAQNRQKNGQRHKYSLQGEQAMKTLRKEYSGCQRNGQPEYRIFSQCLYAITSSSVDESFLPYPVP